MPTNKPGYALSISGTVQPDLGAGVAAPIGCLYQRRDGNLNQGLLGDLWVKSGIEDTDWDQLQVVVPVTSQAFSIVATGFEGTQFMVPMPLAMANTGYTVQITPACVNGSANAFKLYRLVSSLNTVGEFYVESNVAMEAGDILQFFVTF